MKLRMIGIDQTRASLKVRENYAFTSSSARLALQKLKQTEGIRGCLILSTCNRTELYVSTVPEMQLDLYGMLCESRGNPCGAQRELFRELEDLEAARHVFELSGGLCSQIMGEDQILTQVKQALALAREEEATDRCIEVLFRQAITCAKELKSNDVFEKGNRSAAAQAIRQLREEGAVFAGKTALVIGNGMMGRLCAQALMEEQAQVTVTVRQYRSGMVDIPRGAARMNYGERYDMVPAADYIFSATASPNLTITADRLSGIDLSGKTFVDLAVPRDMEPGVRDLPGVHFLDMDDLNLGELSEHQRQQLQEMERHIDAAMGDFERFFAGRDMLPRIGKLADAAGSDLWGRVRKTAAVVDTLPPAGRQELEQVLRQKGSQVVARVLYALRDGLDPEAFAQCMDILEED
jgi:glutamyl-tRNA reductase